MPSPPFDSPFPSLPLPLLGLSLQVGEGRKSHELGPAAEVTVAEVPVGAPVPERQVGDQLAGKLELLDGPRGSQRGSCSGR